MKIIQQHYPLLAMSVVIKRTQFALLEPQKSLWVWFFEPMVPDLKSEHVEI